MVKLQTSSNICLGIDGLELVFGSKRCFALGRPCSMQDLQISDTGLSFVAGGMESSALRLICSARAGCWLFHDSTMPRKISKASAFWSNGPKQLTPQQLAQATPPGTVVRELLATLSQNRKLLKKWSTGSRKSARLSLSYGPMRFMTIYGMSGQGSVP
jgi:hypothetical protein